MGRDSRSRSLRTAYMAKAMHRRIGGSLYMPVDQKTTCGKNAMKRAAHRAAARSKSLAAIA